VHQILLNRWPSYLVDLATYNVTDPQRRQLSSTTRAAVVRYDGHRVWKACISLSAVLTSGTVFLSQLETLTVIQHSDEHSSRICSLCFFLVTVSVHSTDLVIHSRPLYCCRTGHCNILLLYCMWFLVTRLSGFVPRPFSQTGQWFPTLISLGRLSDRLHSNTNPWCRLPVWWSSTGSIAVNHSKRDWPRLLLVILRSAYVRVRDSCFIRTTLVKCLSSSSPTISLLTFQYNFTIFQVTSFPSLLL